MSDAKQPVRLCVRDHAIELAGYEPEATVRDLVEEIERFRLRETHLITSACAGCGLCCHQRPPVFAQDMDDLAAGSGRLVDADDRRRFLSSVLEYPSPPDMRARAAGIRDLARDMGMTPGQATGTYEYNRAEPIVLRHGADGMCGFLRDGMCTIYPYRPLTCRLYLCNMGERLSLLQERIATEGTWHAYEALGWTEGVDMAHNTFRRAARQMDLPLALFEPRADDDDPRKLFFYF